MQNKIKAVIALLTILGVGMLGFLTPASATGGTQYEGKNQDLCHATGQDGKYVSLTGIPVEAILQNNGHAYHQDGRDIIPAFTYYEKIDGEWIEKSFPGQGDQSLLQYENCQVPDEGEVVAIPEYVFADPCVTKNDTMSVPPGEGYTVGPLVKDGLVWSITVTLNNEIDEWSDGTTAPITFTHTFTNEDCDLPDTGLGATFNTTGGYIALGALLLGGLVLLTGGKVRRNRA